MTEQIQDIPVRDLVISRFNPRKELGDLKELEASIRQQGVLEPLVAVKENGHFAVVAGQRRLAAARLAQLVEVPVVVRDMTDEEQAAAALVENLQRRDLAPLEEARGYRSWLDLTGKTQKDLAAAVGKDPSTISNALRLLDAPKPVQKALADGRITAAHARVALQLNDPGLATKLSFTTTVKEYGKKQETRPATVDELKGQVDGLNTAAELNGAPAIARAKAFLEKARADHKTATITWEKQKDFAYAREVLDLVKVLGKPPADVVGPLGDGTHPRYVGMGTAPTAAAHDKVCECRAFLITASRDYRSNMGTGGLKLELGRVCIDRAGWKKAYRKPKQQSRPKASKPAAPKPLTPAQVARQEADARKRTEKDAARALETRQLVGAPAAVARRLGTKIPADVARAVLAFRIAMESYEDDVQLLAWERALKMPAKKASQLAASFLGEDLEQELFFRERQLTTATFAGRVAQHFGMKVAQPKPEPKARKAAKRAR